ncbi:hypothetical protein [Butyrivibrio sp. AE3004]|uniref:hypothetical protein n=1 Tax=Butyrivibrio sp. AE3004 TaxID=1506994 RepID=UPI000494433D|nr:hypothetical protein [Butyrivibrio sp. AE3004]
MVNALNFSNNSALYITNFIAFIILIWIYVIDGNMRRSKRLDDIRFKMLGATVLLMIVTDVLTRCGLDYSEHPIIRGVSRLFLDFSPTIHLINCYCWLKFVDAVVNNDPKRLKKRYRLAFLPILYVAVLLAFFHLIIKDESLLIKGFWTLVYLSAYLGTAIFMMREAYIMAHGYTKELKNPIFLRLDIFIVLWTIGFLSGVGNLDSICEAVGLYLTYMFIKRRYRYLDKDMMFYNENFVGYLEDYEKKVGIRGGYVVILTSDMTDILKEALIRRAPKKSIIVRTEDDSFIVYTEIKIKSAIQVFIITLQDEAVRMNPDINIDAQYLIQKENESVGGITERLKKRLKAYERISRMQENCTGRGGAC